jgi:3D (Asp-Asp-Asp) domain-containing protein
MTRSLSCSTLLSAVAAAVLMAGCQTDSTSAVNGKDQPRRLTMEATATVLKGNTASGTRARPGSAAADPRVIPLGSKVRVTGAGDYSGNYTIEDTGRHIKGNRIDLYVETRAGAREFGRQHVEVEILQRGTGKVSE